MGGIAASVIAYFLAASVTLRSTMRAPSSARDRMPSLP
jgi:hypothetical protein